MNKKYNTLNYISGTTWVAIDGIEQNFLIGYFSMEKLDYKLKVGERSLIEKQRFARQLASMLNGAVEIQNEPGKPHLCGVLCGEMNINKTNVVFKDCLFGKIVVSSYIIASGGEWQPSPIPSDVVKDLEIGFAHTLKCHKKSLY